MTSWMRGDMGLLDRLRAEVHVPDADGVRVLDVPSVMNLRELGGYDTPDGPTKSHRFLRCGSTRCATRKDRDWLAGYGLTHVLDLRGQGESPAVTCPYARDRSVVWKNVSFYGTNLSDPQLVAARKSLDYLTGGYLTMLGNHEAVCQIVGFLAHVPLGECALFHCAAGMDRTGMVSMLLLGAAGVSRSDIIRDYLYSFGRVREVDHIVDTGELPEPSTGSRLEGRLATISGVYDVMMAAYGSVKGYLLACGVPAGDLELLRQRLIG